MGTSTDFSGGRGGAWTGYKRAATSFAKHGGRERAGRALARHVATLGGAGGAAGGAVAGSRAAQRLGGFLAGVAEGGLAEGLERLGLGHLVGRSRYDVLTALIEDIAGTGGDLEAAAAQSAALDVLDELLPDGDEYDELDELALDEDGVHEALALFLARFVYYRAAPVIEARLNRLDPGDAEARDKELRAYITELVKVRIQDTNPSTLDWSGDSGRQTADNLLRDLYEFIEALDQ